MRDFYRRRLPHYQPPDAIFSVTLRLIDSLPQSVLENLIEGQQSRERWLEGLPDGLQKRASFARSREQYARRFDDALHNYTQGPQWLSRVDIADVVKDALAYANASWCSVLAYCIMSNHAHALLGVGQWQSSIGIDEADWLGSHAALQAEFPLTQGLASFKKYSARRANRLLVRSGAFWQQETFDHLIRSGEELERTAWYVLLNPVKAGLCREWQEWPWTYCSPWLQQRLQ